MLDGKDYQYWQQMDNEEEIAVRLFWESPSLEEINQMYENETRVMAYKRKRSNTPQDQSTPSNPPEKG